jgi:hypothetical protein
MAPVSSSSSSSSSRRGGSGGSSGNKRTRAALALVAAAGVAGNASAFAPLPLRRHHLQHSSAVASSGGLVPALRVLNERVSDETMTSAATLEASAEAALAPETELAVELRSRSIDASAAAAVVARSSKAGGAKRVAKEAKLVIEGDTVEDEPHMVAVLGAFMTIAAVMTGGAVMVRIC